MDLPMVSSCTLDANGLRSQLDRYRRAGRQARLVSRNRRNLVVDLDEHVDEPMVAEMIAIERECCSFFDLDWDPERHRLTISVPDRQHEPALDAIAFALDIETSDASTTA